MRKLPDILLDALNNTVKKLAVYGKGLLAADESLSTISKRFAAVNIPCNEATRCEYRELLFATPHINQHISGVILYEETLNQKSSNGIFFTELLLKNNIIPGIKVDKGLILLVGTEDEKISQGLDELQERLIKYKEKGVQFAKWRSVFSITETTPSPLAITSNSEVLARYAAICQHAGIVPIVEPEVLIEGNHTLERCADVTETVLHQVFHQLYKHNVLLEYSILKPSMVIAGKENHQEINPELVANATIKILRRTVPAALPSINFLSGGQSPEQATANLNAMHINFDTHPWNISFSYARALQEPCLKIWAGKNENKKLAQEAFYLRVKLNGLAAIGKYKKDMEPL